MLAIFLIGLFVGMPLGAGLLIAFAVMEGDS